MQFGSNYPQQALKVCRQLGLKHEPFSGYRMIEAEFSSVEKLPIQACHCASNFGVYDRLVSSAAIHFIADDRVPDRRQVYSNLMGSAGL